MKKLFIYYSYTGNGEIVGEYFKNNEYDVYKVKAKKRVVPKSFFFGMLVGGFKATVGSKPEIEEINIDLASYDKIVIGSPIWNARLAPVTNSLLEKLDLKDKDVSFVLYSGSGAGKKALKKINEKFPGASVTFLKEPKKYNEELNKIVL